eukprot:1050413-Prymnesium_polylepis.1
MPRKCEYVIGSGPTLHAPPNSVGYFTWSQRADQPPLECPTRKRARPALTARNCSSRCGINSFIRASPTGPLFALSANRWWPWAEEASRRTRRNRTPRLFDSGIAPRRLFAREHRWLSVFPKPGT